VLLGVSVVTKSTRTKAVSCLKDMNLEEFEAYYRDSMDETLNQLQAVTLLIAQVETKIADVGTSVQNLSQAVEEFITQERTQ
jgi:hypothetical protein